MNKDRLLLFRVEEAARVLIKDVNFSIPPVPPYTADFYKAVAEIISIGRDIKNMRRDEYDKGGLLL